MPSYFRLTLRLFNYLVFSIFLAFFVYPEAGALEYSSKAPLVSRSLLLDGTAVDGTMVVVGERGHVLVSTDNGGTWKQADVPSRATLTGVFFHDQHLGWAVGHDQVILKTHDGGRSWKQVYSSPEADRPLLDVWFADSLKGFAIGAYGLLLKTTDGGNTWSQRYVKIGRASCRERV